ncbi:phosphatase/phosphohexomutase-related hydrolase [Citrifermentans bemidjiense Bem]|uniref:Phosphatase/phosphohexomutase-related hydrolase n=1 Tax=Citrifermentans bemidjiense (strain ATCC BAA-1014 / DSM 16622 / JCM 12645 / Bem) TaxID=404380 RepID=B5E8S0_CITBB|nr:HAD family phosphatase [Citrifermentans bemidjiense]ACH40084.1 phosphatase/phosphohexomutase-related hydrolase [Citrifermentans bemidjiense Bem]
MLNAVIFDFDGVIVDTEPLHYKAFQELLVPLGLGYSWEEYLDRYIGFDDRDAFREAFAVAGRALSDGGLKELIHGKAQAFLRIVSVGVAPYAGVVELIRSISGNLPLALCSGALRSDIDPILAQLGLSDAFDVMVTADEVAASKPDPESYRLAVTRLQEAFPGKVDASASIAIEDTPAGIASASGAGLKVLAVTNSYPRERLTGACRVLNSLSGVDLEGLRLLV